MSQSKWCFTTEEDEKLIEAISVHPALFDLKHESYKDQRVKDNIWIIVAGEVGRSVADCKKRWKNVKDTFDRKKRDNNKTGSEAPPIKKGKKTWALQDRLSFLHAAEDKRRSFCNVSVDPEDSDNRESANFDETEDVDDPFDMSTTPSPQPVVSRPSSANPHITHSAQTTTITPARSETEGGAIRKKSNYREKICSAIEQRSKERDAMIRDLLKQDEDPSDDLSHFFKSIEQTVRKFPPHLQQRPKLETLSLISKIESDMWCTRSDNFFRVPQPQMSSSSPSPSSASTPSDNCLLTVDNNEGGLARETNVNFGPCSHQEGDPNYNFNGIF